MGGFLGFNFDLKDQLVFYGSYHNNKWNQLVHFVFVPAIWWTVAVWLAYTPEAFTLPGLASRLPAWAADAAPHLRFNGSFCLAAGYSLYYLALEPLAGGSWAAFVGLPLWAAANWFRSAVPDAWAWALGLHLLSWFVQIAVGHQMAEKRKPALLDSFFQSLVLAPLFVWFELLFLLGLYPGLHAEVQTRVLANIADWKRGQGKKAQMADKGVGGGVRPDSAAPDSREPSAVLLNPTYQGENGSNGKGLEQGLTVMIDRMDRISELMRRHTTGHYIRAYVPLDIANPAPLGFMAFALSTCLFMTQQAGITEASTQFMAFPLGIFFGGMTMLVVAVLEILRRNALGGAAFGTYGSFWISVGVYGIIRTAGIFFLDAPKGQEALTAIFGVASIGFMVVSSVINLALPLLFLLLAIMFFLLSAGTQRTDVGKAAGWFGIFTSAYAFYLGLATLFEDMWGMEVLPMFYTKLYKKHAKILFPRVSEHDPLDITAGYPYPGRPQISSGDNLSALGPTPSLMSNFGLRGRAAVNTEAGAAAEQRPAAMV